MLSSTSFLILAVLCALIVTGVFWKELKNQRHYYERFLNSHKEDIQRAVTRKVEIITDKGLKTLEF